MVFSSPIFLFWFLPITLLFYYAVPKAFRNISLLLMSLFFYAWGEVFYAGVMVASIISNYCVGRLIFSAYEKQMNRYLPKLYLVSGVAINVVLLLSFKYANFIVDNLNAVLSIFGVASFELQPIHLPLGISFFTFQAISYVVDVYRREVKAQKNILDLALYISLFPQLVAGPIVRYHDVAFQITKRECSINLFSQGVQRFVVGLGKKMLIANVLGQVADNAFSVLNNGLTMPLAWIGILAYTLQIYYDFSGYSDMAIGLGKMFGFTFLENFNYPYVAKSMREFWKRWHISLSTWFRDYVYIPLGGSRVATWRVYMNLLLVFFVTGIWHGASWNFVAWGMFHGFFLMGEHLGFSKVLKKAWVPFQHLYVVGIVIVSWVFFRAETMSDALAYLRVMVNVNAWETTSFQYTQVVSGAFWYTFLIGCLCSFPVYVWLKKYLTSIAKGSIAKTVSFVYVPRILFLVAFFMFSILKISSSTYNPFIYFRF